MKGPERLGSSFRDPSGFVFRHHGAIYRQVNQRYRPAYDHLRRLGARGAPRGARAAPALRGGRPVARPERRRLQDPPPPAARLRLPSLRVVSGPAPGRRSPHAPGPAGRARPWHDAEGRLGVQHPVRRGPAGLHRPPLLRPLRGGRALARLPPVLPALPGPTRAGLHGGRPADPAPARPPRRDPARPRRPAPALAEPPPALAPRPRAPPHAEPGPLPGRRGGDPAARDQPGPAPRARPPPGDGHPGPRVAPAGHRVGRLLCRDQLHGRRPPRQAAPRGGRVSTAWRRGPSGTSAATSGS